MSADTAADFSIGKNVKNLHVLFMPEVKSDASGQRKKTFITGCNVQEAPKNDVDTSKPTTNGGSNSGNTGSNTGGSTGGNTGGNTGDNGGDNGGGSGEGPDIN